MRSSVSGIQIPTASRLNVDGEFTLDSLSGTSGHMLVSQGAGNTPAWSNTLTSPTIDIINAASSSSTTADLFGNVTTGTVGIADGLTTGTLNIGNGTTTTTGRTVNINTNASGNITVTTNIGSSTLGGKINLYSGLGYINLIGEGTIKTENKTSANSASLVLKTGDITTSGTSGNVIIDVGTGVTANGTISIGTSSASGLTIGRSTVTTTVNGTLSSADARLNNPLLTSISTVGGGGGEGGQINFARVTDGAQYWAIDSFGTTASPDLRIVENVSERWRFVAGGSTLNASASGTISAVSTSVNGNSISLNGGSSTGTTGQTGGAVNITGGFSTSGTGINTGGNINITGGASNTTAGVGGSVTIRGGLGSAANGNGAITIGDANTDSINIGRTGITTTVSGTLFSGKLNTDSLTASNQFGSSWQIGTYSAIGTSTTGAPIMMTAGTTSQRFHIGFSISGSRVGGVSTSGTSTTYSTTSDYRLKENIQPVPDAINRLLQLNPVRFTWIKHPELPAVDGFLAHEAQEVVPECATGEKDGVDENGNPDYQGIDQSKLVPLLTAALQDAIKKIDSLEERLAILENK